MGAEETNGDGFGVGWYGDRDTPAIFHSVEPAWNDRNLRELAGHISSPLVFAHIRASTGSPVQQTNCHPFLVQALCSQLIDTLNVEKRERVESTDIEHAVKQVVESWDGYFDDLWKRCDESQRSCLLALNKQEGDEGMELDDIQQHSQLDPKSIRQVLRALVSRDLVIDHEDGTYRIAAPIFRWWVKYNS